MKVNVKKGLGSGAAGRAREGHMTMSRHLSWRTRAASLWVAAFAVWVGWLTPASATMISQGSSPFTVNWSCSSNICDSPPGTIPPAGVTISGSATFSNFTFTTEVSGIVDLSLNISINNTTPQGALSTADWQSVRLTSFGWDMVPNLVPGSTVSTTSTVYPTALLNEV